MYLKVFQNTTTDSGKDDTLYSDIEMLETSVRSLTIQTSGSLTLSDGATPDFFQLRTLKESAAWKSDETFRKIVSTFMTVHKRIEIQERTLWIHMNLNGQYC